MPWTPPPEDRVEPQAWTPPAADRVEAPIESSTPGAVWRKFAHGVVPFDAQIVGLGNALERKLGVRHGANGTLVSGDNKSFGDIYAEERDARRKQLAADQAQHPTIGRVADIAGTLAGPLRFLPGSTLKQAVTSGAAVGGLRGLADSETPGVVGTAKDVAIGTGLGGAGGAAGYGLMQMARPAFGLASNVLQSKAIGNARRVLVGKQNSLSAKVPVSNDAAQEALDVGAIVPLGTTTGTAKRLGAELDRVGDQYGRIVRALEAKGVTGPDAKTLAQTIEAEGNSVALGTMNRSVPTIYRQVAEDLPSKASGGLLPLSRAESLKRSLQDQAKSAYAQQQPGEVGQAQEAVAALLRRANENAIDSQAAALGPEAKAIAAQFVPVKQQYGRLAEAAGVAQAGANRIANHAGPNLTDAVAAGPMAAAHGIGAGMAAKAFAKLVRQRGPSTAAWIEDALAKQAAGAAADPSAAAVPAGQAILNWLRSNQEKQQ